MPNFKQMYTTLFNAITDVVEQLKTAQQSTEEMYTSADDMPIHLDDGSDD